MKALPPEIRMYRILGFSALLHVGVLLGSFRFAVDHPPFVRLWLGLTALWFLWPVVLAFHRGRSARRFSIFALPAAVLFLPCVPLFKLEAPSAFGLPIAVDLNPGSAWKYVSAYRSGRADAERDLAADTLAIEAYGFGAGGRYVQIFEIATRLTSDSSQNASSTKQ